MDIDKIKKIARQAGKATLEVYKKDFSVEYKNEEGSNKSPLTEADRKSNDLITKKLKELHPDIPILSEESKKIPYQERRGWNRFWLVDPLDGTREFVKGREEFTVNIALIENQDPALGVIYIPVKDVIYYTKPYKQYSSAFKQKGDSEPVRIKSGERLEDKSKIKVMVSRSSFNEKTRKYIESLGKEYNLIRKGSSLKLCAIAEGNADIYPRFGRTMEWDTGAGHAIVKSAGKGVYKFEDGDIREELEYNKKSLKNPYFVVK